MDMENYFTKLEDDSKKQNIDKQQEEEKEFVHNLPEWDLEPPYETIRRERN